MEWLLSLSLATTLGLAAAATVATAATATAQYRPCNIPAYHNFFVACHAFKLKGRQAVAGPVTYFTVSAKNIRDTDIYI